MSFSVSATSCSSFKVRDEAKFLEWTKRFPLLVPKKDTDGRYWLEVIDDDGRWPTDVGNDESPDFEKTVHLDCDFKEQ